MKKILIPVLAVAMAVFSAFATKPTTTTFRFDGTSSTDWQQRVDPEKYTMVAPQGCDGTPTTLCSIEAVQDGSTGLPLIVESSQLYNDLRNSGGTTPVFASSAIDGKP